MSFTIEKGVPIPSNKCKYPFKEMDIGDSFFINFDKVEDYNKERQYIYQKIWKFKINNKGKNFRTKSSIKGIRIWRIT